MPAARARDEIAAGVGPRRASSLGCAVALPLIVLVALLAGYWLSGRRLDLLKPRRWDELLSGLGGGLQALGTVRLPYRSADPWPRIVLELLGARAADPRRAADVLAARGAAARRRGCR